MNRAAVTVLLLLAPLAGCHPAEEALQSRREALDIQAAIARYSQDVPDTYEIQERWARGLVALAQTRDVATMRTLVGQTIAPQLRTYRDRIATMPAGTDALRQIHAGMVAAHTDLLDRVDAFGADLTEATYERKRLMLNAGLIAFVAAQRRYRKDLDAYYRANSADLIPPPPIDLAVATEPAG